MFMDASGTVMQTARISESRNPTKHFGSTKLPEMLHATPKMPDSFVHLDLIILKFGNANWKKANLAQSKGSSRCITRGEIVIENI